jgi:serine/threonine protein kinase
LKPENILYTTDLVVKICDFGSSKQILQAEKSTPYIVSRYYRSPELLMGCNVYNYSIDIFAVGCIMAELFTINPLFAGKTEGLQFFEHICLLGKPDKKYFDRFNLTSDIKTYFCNLEENKKYDLRKILNVSGIYSAQDVDFANDLIEKCMLWDWDSRITAEEAILHPFFYGLQ